MAFKKCAQCAAMVRIVDERCWSCGGKVFDTEPATGRQTPHQAAREVAAQSTPPGPAPVRCPGCGSTDLTANRKGFGWGKSLVGGVLTGGVGLVAGFIGSRKVLVTCINCGKQWQAGSHGE